MELDYTVAFTQVNGKNAVISWTGGKDGCFSCLKAMSEGYRITHLLHFTNVKKRGSHELNLGIIRAQSESMGIPLMQQDFFSYEEEFKKAIRDLRAKGERIDGAVFGHIETHKNLVDRICGELDLELVMPLWKQDSKRLLREMIASGLEIVVVSVKGDLMGKEWLGRRIDGEFICDLERMDASIDHCGENGEFHTLVTDSPLFGKKIHITGASRIFQDGYWYLDIHEWTLQEKGESGRPGREK